MMVGLRTSKIGRGGWHMIDEIELVPLIVEHSRWRQLGARLETIADALPTLPTLIEVAALRCQLRDAFPEKDDAQAFPLETMFAAQAGERQVRHLLDGLHERRVRLTVEAQDLADMITADPGRLSADTLGYMLRAVFGGCRETIALETLALLFIAPQRLTGAARAVLMQHMARDDGSA